MKDMLGRGEALSVSEALGVLLSAVSSFTPAEVIVPLEHSYGRVLSKDVFSPEDLPGFSRSTVDGFAVLSSDTFGAAEGSPAYLDVVGEVPMGKEPDAALRPGEAIRISTGGMIPPGADAVLMLEHAQMADAAMVEAQRAVAPGENVIRKGEDMAKGESLCRKGHLIRAEDVALMAGLGMVEAPVYERTRVSIISTGDEVVPHGSLAAAGLVRDMNSFILEGMVLEEGGMPGKMGIIRDDYALMRAAVEEAAANSGMVLVSGGSSVGARDLTEKVMSDLGSVLFHSVAMKPGKPFMAGLIGSAAVFGLPGHPRAVSVCFNVFVRPALRLISGRILEGLDAMGGRTRARLLKAVHSSAGREDVVCVRLMRIDGELWAEPLLGKSGLISTLVRSHGTITVPADRIGLRKDESVEVTLRRQDAPALGH